MHNQWYEISCASLYERWWFPAIVLVPILAWRCFWPHVFCPRMLALDHLPPPTTLYSMFKLIPPLASGHGKCCSFLSAAPENRTWNAHMVVQYISVQYMMYLCKYIMFSDFIQALPGVSQQGCWGWCGQALLWLLLPHTQPIWLPSLYWRDPRQNSLE